MFFYSFYLSFEFYENFSNEKIDGNVNFGDEWTKMLVGQSMIKLNIRK